MRLQQIRFPKGHDFHGIIIPASMLHIATALGPFGVFPQLDLDHRHAHGFGKRIQSPYFATGSPETEEMTTLYAPGMLGCVAEFDTGGRAGPPNVCTYQLVKMAAGITVAVGNVTYWSNKGLWTVTTSRTNRGQLAGIGRIAGATAASYVWVLKKGDRTVLFQAAPSSAPDATGKPVVPGAVTDGTADCLANAAGQAAFPLIGTSLGATASDLALVRVNLPDAA